MQPLALRRSRTSGVRVDHHLVRGEQLPFAHRVFDCVVSTFTLCSIDDVARALAEVQRVLTPGGRLLFLEHGLAPEPWVQRWQRRLNWLEGRLGDGCRLDRAIPELVAAQPFASVQSRAGYLGGVPKTHGYLYQGMATR
jgi:SAM-dependent methyltransferase